MQRHSSDLETFMHFMWSMGSVFSRLMPTRAIKQLERQDEGDGTYICLWNNNVLSELSREDCRPQSAS